MVSYLVEGACFERIEQMTWAANIQNSSISFNTGLMESMSLSWELATSDKNWDSVPTSIWANDITDFNGIVTEEIMEHHFTDFTFFISIIINTTIIPVASELEDLVKSFVIWGLQKLTLKTWRSWSKNCFKVSIRSIGRSGCIASIIFCRVAWWGSTGTSDWAPTSTPFK